MLSDDDLNLAAGHALGVLDAASLARAEARLDARDAEFEKAVAEFTGAAALLAQPAAGTNPPADVRARLMALASAEKPMTPDAFEAAPAVAASRPAKPVSARAESAPALAPRPASSPARVAPIESRRSFIERWGRAFAGAAALLALASAFLLVQQSGLRRQLAAMDERSRSLEAQLLEAHERGKWLDVWGAPSARIVTLGATANGIPQLGGRAVYDPGSQRAIVVFDHVSAPAGKDLQLWALRPDGPAGLGLVKPDGQGHAELRIEQIGDPGSLSAFAVSLEPPGGSPEPGPTGPFVLVGRLPG